MDRSFYRVNSDTPEPPNKKGGALKSSAEAHLSDGPLPLAAPALSAALLGFLLLLRLGRLLHVGHSILELVPTCGRHAAVTRDQDARTTDTRAHWHMMASVCARARTHAP